MKALKRILTISCVMCLLIMGIQPLASCNKSETVINTAEEPQTYGTSGLGNERTNISDELPERDFDGVVFNVLVKNTEEYEFYVEEENSEIINDAVYARNRTIEDRFNIKITSSPVAGGWNDQATFLQTLRSSVSAGDDTYQLVAGYAAYITVVATEGLFYNFKNNEYINFDKPWWSQDIVNEFTIDGKLFYATGDIALTVWDRMCVVLFNKQLVADFGIADPYDTVRQGKWTLDTFAAICKDTYRDINGNGERDEGDLYGFVTSIGTYTDTFTAAFDQPVTIKNSHGDPEIVIGNSPKMIEMADKLYELFYNSDDIYTKPEAAGDYFNRDMFRENRALFITDALQTVQALRDMENDFGILPYPKWNEQQEKYTGVSQDSYTLISIPVSVQDIDMVSIITEALAAESYKQVIPAYYDKALKSKFARDEQSAEMMDIIRDGLLFNFGYLNSIYIELPFQQLRILMGSKSRDFVSTWAKVSESADIKLEQIIDDYKSLN